MCSLFDSFLFYLVSHTCSRRSGSFFLPFCLEQDGRFTGIVKMEVMRTGEKGGHSNNIYPKGGTTVLQCIIGR